MGSSPIESAVRAALLPRLGTPDVSSRDDTLITPALGVAGFSPVPELRLTSDHPSTYSGLGAVQTDPHPHDKPISTSILWPSTLDTIQESLVRGERRKAYRYALDQKLWAHAMIIASSIDKEAWQEVASEFLRTELGVKQSSNDGSVSSPLRDERGPLRVAYSLYSGSGAPAGPFFDLPCD